LGNSENNSHHDQGSFANSCQKCLSKMVIENCRAKLDLTLSQQFPLLETRIKKHNLWHQEFIARAANFGSRNPRLSNREIRKFTVFGPPFTPLTPLFSGIRKVKKFY
jgi:hypothetical protein